MSDSFNNLGATDFPCQAVQDMTVVRDLPIPPAPGTPGSDEGRAMVSCPVGLLASHALDGLQSGFLLTVVSCWCVVSLSACTQAELVCFIAPSEFLPSVPATEPL